MTLAHFVMLIHELLHKYLDIFPEEAPLIVLDSKSSMCMAKNGKDTKHTRQISRIMHLLVMEKSERCTRLIGVSPQPE